jgi:uncharacterized SAM-binding protein YcdF (DUF218 family)
MSGYLSMAEFIKQIILPSNLVLLFLAAGIILLLARRRKRAGLISISLGAAIYIFFATGVISLWLLGSLEHRYGPLSSAANLQDVKRIVILAGYAERHEGLPLTSEVNFASAYRLMEGLRIAHLLPEAQILISGGSSVPGIMMAVLTAMGVEPQRIAIESGSGSTHESAENLKGIIGGERMILVTSAGHMPRAMGVFTKAGMNPVPAPTNYMSVRERRFMDYLPSPRHLVYADLAVHEYLGMAWYRLTGKM